MTYSIPAQYLGNFFRSPDDPLARQQHTYSHTMDDGTFTTFVSTPQNLYDRNGERADSVQDVRHRFVANFVARGPAKTFLKNFEFSDILNLQSGRPFTIFVGNDINNDTNPVTDRVGLSRRNSYRGDPLYSNDVRFSYQFGLSERKKLQLAVDAFNVFNRPNVDEVTSVYGGGTIDFCGATPTHYKDAASLAIQQVQVSCPANNGGLLFPIRSLGPRERCLTRGSFSFRRGLRSRTPS